MASPSARVKKGIRGMFFLFLSPCVASDAEAIITPAYPIVSRLVKCPRPIQVKHFESAPPNTRSCQRVIATMKVSPTFMKAKAARSGLKNKMFIVVKIAIVGP